MGRDSGRDWIQIPRSSPSGTYIHDDHGAAITGWNLCIGTTDRPQGPDGGLSEFIRRHCYRISDLKPDSEVLDSDGELLRAILKYQHSSALIFSPHFEFTEGSTQLPYSERHGISVSDARKQNMATPRHET